MHNKLLVLFPVTKLAGVTKIRVRVVGDGGSGDGYASIVIVEEY